MSVYETLVGPEGDILTDIKIDQPLVYGVGNCASTGDGERKG